MSNEKACPLCGHKPAPLDVKDQPLYCSDCQSLIDILTMWMISSLKPRPVLLFRAAQEIADAERAMSDLQMKSFLTLAASALCTGEPS